MKFGTNKFEYLEAKGFKMFENQFQPLKSIKLLLHKIYSSTKLKQRHKKQNTRVSGAKMTRKCCSGYVEKTEN